MSKYQKLVKQSRLYPVLRLETLLSHARRHKWLGAGRLLLFIWLAVLFAYYFLAGQWLLVLVGFFLVSLAFWLGLWLVEAYFRSYYFASIITNEYRPEDIFTFTVGRILYVAAKDDLAAGLMVSALGRRLLRRAGISEAAAGEFLARRRQMIAPELLPPPPEEGVLRLRRLVEILLGQDEEFRDFLFRHEVRPEDFLAIAAWAVREVEGEALAERWWSRERLQRIPGFAKDWAYGETYTLEKYGRDLRQAPQAVPTPLRLTLRLPELEQLETILTRRREANAILVSAPGPAKLEVVWQLAREINAGRVVPELEGKRPILFNVSLFLSDFKEKSELEKILLKIFREATRAGNVILVIDDLAALVAGAEVQGANPLALMDPYLVSPQLPVVALADSDSFHQYLEPRGALMRRFEKIWVAELELSVEAGPLEDLAFSLEKSYSLWFTYPAILTVAQGAEQYFQSESVAEKATDLLIELASWARAQGLSEVSREAVWQFIRQKTKIPVGQIEPVERERLLELELMLRQRVIGQTAALRAVSQALRRSRSGIRSQRRPIGSFLFLGPTGVGKTETAKALAAVFFDREEALLRLDMSEYQSSDALTRLVGSFLTGKPGILSNILRQNPYGVLLLDEFEKTTPEVLNLFLQILDEGFFSDMTGKRVNARNVIFIATSNAGADLVWQMVKAGDDPAARRDELINALVKSGIFRPELLNRFDDVIIFHPLNDEELRAVAKLLLGRLVKRLEEKGIRLSVNQMLVEQVVRFGANRVFGARPMLRYIQDAVEEPIARQIISGQVRRGATIEFVSDGREPPALSPRASYQV